jgi:hypothetical protein
MGQCAELLVREQNHTKFIQQLPLSMKGMVRQKIVHLKIVLYKPTSSTLKTPLNFEKIDYERWATAQNKSESENCNKFEFRFETA